MVLDSKFLDQVLFLGIRVDCSLPVHIINQVLENASLSIETSCVSRRFHNDECTVAKTNTQQFRGFLPVLLFEKVNISADITFRQGRKKRTHFHC